MKKVLTIFAILLLTISCKKEVHQNENEIIEENLEPKLNFEVINSSKSEFHYTENTGGSIMVSYQTHFSHFQNITIKNNSNTAFNQFNIKSEIMATFENGDAFTKEGFGRSDSSTTIQNLWKPNTSKTFNIETYGPFEKELMKRTPVSLIITFTFNAKGIDGELEEIQSFNIIEDWKNFQKKLGYRQ